MHISCQKEYFDSLDFRIKKKVKVADGKEITAEGIGQRKLQCMTDEGKIKDNMVEDVLHIPNFHGSLCLWRSLIAKSYQFC